jgi:hypothetical protein
MPSTISAGTTAGTAIAVAGDTTGNLAFQTNGTTTAMTIDTSQNVGIGTTSTSYRLTVTETSGGEILNVTNNADADFKVNCTSGVTKIGPTTGVLAFQSGSTTERGRFDSSGNFLFNSGYGSVATAYGCRAWVNFNGTGTVAIRASGNVSSVSDGGTGNYTINFTNAMPDANYSVTECIQADVTNSNRNLTIKGGTSITTSSFSVVVTGTASSTTYDVPVVNLAIFR